MARYLYNFLMFTVLLFGFPIMLPLLLTVPKRRKIALQRFWLGFDREVWQSWRRETIRPTIWVHALSLGEVMSAQPLIRELEKIHGSQSVVFSVSTLTGFEIATQNMAPHVRRVFYFPYDLPFSVVRAVNLVKPDLVLIVETDLWPNFMACLRMKAIPALLVNARLSNRSANGYRRIPQLIKPLLDAFGTICVQSDEDARRFIAVGARPDRVQVTGNMKFDQPVTPLSDRELEQERRRFGLQEGDPVIVAGSTHPGEEEILLAGVIQLKEKMPALKLILAPRDPQRATTVAKLVSARILKIFCLTEIEKQVLPRAADVIVIDRIGILGRIYVLGDVAFIGGSLVKAGGHNPLEPAAHGKPVLFGPHMTDFRLIARWLLEGRGAAVVTDADTLVAKAVPLLSNMDELRTAGENALRVFGAHAGAIQRIRDIMTRTYGWIR